MYSAEMLQKQLEKSSLTDLPMEKEILFQVSENF